MTRPAVVFDHVWKKFWRGERHDSLRDLIPWAVKGLFGPRASQELEQQEFWAVEDVSFAVESGQALGIIGPNGAGKSTTLKLLTRILRPNRGACTVRGRAGALIEVAAGFHPDLTGRENVYLQGAIMGMNRTEVAERFDDIVEFAGVGAFIDTQIKRYSSGMNARLGFSIAAHLNPDVLIIDEVLSVGDMSFQDRCVQRMREFKQNGVAIVFVSHNLQAVAELCDVGLYLNRSARATGSASQVIESYVKDSLAPATVAAGVAVDLRTLSLVDARGSLVTEPVEPGTPLRLSVRCRVLQAIEDVTFALVLTRTTDQLKVYDGHFREAELGVRVAQGTELTLEFDLKANVTRGHYYFEVVVVHNPTQRIIAALRPAAHLTVDERRTWGGVASLDVTARAGTAPSATIAAGRS
jgi:lipopolysaccharide transport system ATP-binding protein